MAYTKSNKNEPCEYNPLIMSDYFMTVPKGDVIKFQKFKNQDILMKNKNWGV